MAVIKHHKYVAALPGTLEANSVYYVRTGAGFDIYVTNDSGLVVAYPLNTQSDLRWHVIPLGVPFDIWTHLPGVEVPPTDNPNYRYIKLTASDSYNAGVLTAESVSGSAPLVQATAVISDAGSPMNGQTVQLINTERRFIRPGSSGTVQDDAMQGHWHSYNYRNGQRGLQSPSGSVDVIDNDAASVTFKNNRVTDAVSDGTNGTPRVANETRVKSIGADYFMRIR